MIKILVVYLIYFSNIYYGSANPLPAQSDIKTSFISSSDIWSTIDRRLGSPDLIIPSLCPSPCQKLFKAQNVNVSGTECACQCSAAMPVFLQSTGQCVQKLDECRNNLQFSSLENSSDIAHIPLIVLPTPGNIVASDKRILWKNGGVKQRPETGARCNVTGIFYLQNDRSWQEASPRLLYLGWTENDTKLFENKVILLPSSSSLSSRANEQRASAGDRLYRYLRVQIVEIPFNDHPRGIENGRAINLIDEQEWNGSTTEAKYFSGSIVQIKLDCSSNEKNAHCIVFRAIGKISPHSSDLTATNNMFAHAQSRLETVLIILLSILLFLSIFGSIILWNVCWRLKKTELISTLQMQFLYHVKQEKEKATAEAAHRYQAIARAAAAVQQGVHGDGAMAELIDGAPNVTVKRKLYFSAEFFEPHFMLNPPPMAEQFLHDLRRMIEIAKQKIHLRKHVPQLVSIPEEKEEHYQPYMELHNRDLASPTNICTRNSPTNEIPNEESSPKSTKSSDSGRDSMRESYSSENSDPSSSPKEVKRPLPVIKEIDLTNKENGEMQVKEMLIEKEPDSKKPLTSSRIPVITNGLSKSPRLAVKTSHLSTPKNCIANGYLEAPPLPPRNPSMQEEISPYSPPPLPSSDPPSSPRPSGGIARRKAYAVFPSHESMLKKSLPRRSKKKLSPSNSNPNPTNANGINETNI